MKCVFCDLLKNGKSKFGYPYIPICETKNTVSFLSIDFPPHQEEHTLVIPKKHYKDLHSIPKKVLDELIEHVKKITKALKKKHQGYNILLNDGKVAGQYIPHVHFHVIPRDKNDKIIVEYWKEKNPTIEKFRKVSSRLKNRVK